MKINILNDKVILDGSIDDEPAGQAVKAASAYGEVIDLMQEGRSGGGRTGGAAAAVIKGPV